MSEDDTPPVGGDPTDETFSLGHWEVGLAVVLICLFVLLLCYCLLRWRKKRLEKRHQKRRQDAESGKRLTAGDDLDELDDFELADQNDDDDDDDPDKLLRWAETNIPNVTEDDLKN